MINKYRHIIGISDSREGSCHDLKVLTEGMPDFGKWADRMISGERIPKAHRIRLNADSGYMGIQNYFLGITAKPPHKKPKGGRALCRQKGAKQGTLSKANFSRACVCTYKKLEAHIRKI